MNSIPSISESARDTANAILLGIGAAARIHISEAQAVEVRDLLATSIQSAIDSETTAILVQRDDYHRKACEIADQRDKAESECKALRVEAKELRKMVSVFAGGMTLDEYEREAKRHGGFVSVSVGIGVYREAAAILTRYAARD